MRHTNNANGNAHVDSVEKQLRTESCVVIVFPLKRPNWNVPSRFCIGSDLDVVFSVNPKTNHVHFKPPRLEVNIQYQYDLIMNY